MKQLIIASLLLLTMSACAGKPTQMKFTNVYSHAAVTGACTIVAVSFLRMLDVPSPWNEISGAVACIAAVTIHKEVIKDSVYDHGDMIANTVGGAAAGVSLYLFKWEF